MKPRAEKDKYRLKWVEFTPEVTGMKSSFYFVKTDDNIIYLVWKNHEWKIRSSYGITLSTTKRLSQAKNT